MKINIESQIKDIIYDEVPLNLHCSHCKRDMEASEIITPYRYCSPSDKKQWDRMTYRILDLITNSTINDLTQE